MPSFKFKVDSALLRELGERLVGKPHIALAELVKNSFDADARRVTVRIEEDSIEVADNGHGMTKDEFNAFWMRIGSPHKDQQKLSRRFHRPLTGSKGVGRLAGQFLARNMRIITMGEGKEAQEFVGFVNWEEASSTGELTEATVKYDTRDASAPYPEGSRTGTKIVLEGLNQVWDANAMKDLAREIWWLQPPFRTNPRLKSDEQKDFSVVLQSYDSKLAQQFEQQMQAILQLYYARIVGELKTVRKDGSGVVNVSVEWEDGKTAHEQYHVPDCRLHMVNFEIRVYHLQRRQKYGVKVQETRDYLNRFGNVHIYDAGFHLPYYGPDLDWLRIESDHAHRLSRSMLLPESLQVSGGMEYLPTQSRLLGVVNVDTGLERQQALREGNAKEQTHLQVQITRDRLVENQAYQNLFHAVRWALDFYATRETLRVYEDKKDNDEGGEPAGEKLARIEQALERVERDLDERTYKALREDVREAAAAVDAETEKRIKQANLLGTLATAGISALSFQHEFNKQFNILEAHLGKLEALGKSQASASAVRDIAENLRAWQKNIVATRSLFMNLAESENRTVTKRFRAAHLLGTVAEQTSILLRGIPVEQDEIDEELRLPRGTFAEWSAIFQNVFLNAANAMLDSEERRISVSARKNGKEHSILVQDTGSGVDLDEADGLFEPFVRRGEISEERKALGYGGMGLGLTIVRMLARNLGCEVSFTEPDAGFSTAFRLSWNESHE